MRPITVCLAFFASLLAPPMGLQDADCAAPHAVIGLVSSCLHATPESLTQFRPGQAWPDDNGVAINAHGGGVMFHEGRYYWFGQHMIAGSAGNSAHVGVHCYSSIDLYNWTDEGVALAVSEDADSDIAKGCILERPKVIYNAATGKFVMWFHLEPKSMGYRAARSGVAVADKATGPYTFLRSLRPDAGVWPINVTDEQKAGLKDAEKLKGTSFSGGPNPETPQLNLLARDFADGQMARDMNLFVDDDGKAYHIFASEENGTLHISQLSDDYQSHAGRWVRLFENRWHEAPAICKHQGRYWMITSGCTGWAPNAARSAVADCIWGPWKELGNPCIGVNPHNLLGPELTFGGQSTCILPVNAMPGAFIAMFDIWRPDDAISGGYVWLPVAFEQDRFTVTWRDAWDLSVFNHNSVSLHDPKQAEELRVRDGLPHFFAKATAGKPLRIAYLGGSITAANGWRPKTTAWFQSQYPNAEVIEINAAISGTGSDYGACRIATDVLSKGPDLVFMEHRVNGGGGFEARSVEGIVRQIWQNDPHTDICLVYTLSQGMLADIQSGKTPWFGAIMETVANAYGIPSIDLGVEVARREKAGDLVFKSDTAVAGKVVFSGDGVHPGEAGHDLYRDAIARSMLTMKDNRRSQAHVLPAPLEATCWETASMLPITDVELSPGWTTVDPQTDAVYRDDFGRTDAMLRGAVKCAKTGESVTVRWNGTTVGFSDIPQGGGMEVEVTIDNAEAPITIKRPQTESHRRYARFFYLPEQPRGEHTAVLRVTQLPEGLSFYVGQILVVGTAIP